MKNKNEFSEKSPELKTESSGEKNKVDLGRELIIIKEKAEKNLQDFKTEGSKQNVSLEKMDGKVSSEINLEMKNTEVQAASAKRQLEGLFDLLKRLQAGGKDGGERDESALIIAEIFKDLTTTDGEKTGIKVEKTVKDFIEKSVEKTVVSAVGKKEGREVISLSKQIVGEYKKQTPETRAEAEVEAQKQIEKDVQAEADILAEKLGEKLSPILGEAGGKIVAETTKKQTKKWLEKIKKEGEQKVIEVLADVVCAMDDSESMETVRGVWNKLPQWMQETMVGVGVGGETVRFSLIPVIKDAQSWVGLAVQTGLLDMKGAGSIEEASQRIKTSQKKEVWIFNAALKVFGSTQGLNLKTCGKLSAAALVGVNAREGIADGVKDRVKAYRAAKTQTK